MSLPDIAELVGKREAPGILNMAAVDHIGQRADPRTRIVVEPDRAHYLAIDMGGLFALAQIGDGGIAPVGRNAEGDAAASASAVEAEDQARPSRWAGVFDGKTARRGLPADRPRRLRFDESKARPPHQRAITEHPEVMIGRRRGGRGRD